MSLTLVRPIPWCSQQSRALTLVFAHRTAFHKEQWEPTVDDLQVVTNAEALMAHENQY